MISLFHSCFLCKEKWIAYIIMLGLMVSCVNNDRPIISETILNENISYRLVSFGDEPAHLNYGDFILLDAVFSTQTDSVFWDSRHFKPQGYFMGYNVNKDPDDIISFFNNFSISDSLHFKIKKKSFFKSFFGFDDAPQFVANDSYVNAYVKIVAVFKQSDSLSLIDFTKRKLDSLKNIEKEVIKQKIKGTKSIDLISDSMFFLLKIRSTNDSLVKKAKMVTLSYKGRFLDGKLADYNPENKNFDWRVGEKDQLIPGLQRALLNLKKGEKAKIIIPSRFAFGESGSSSGNIPPYTPLEYEVEILNLNY